ncbi:MAG: aldo/keto reductase [Planctomycetota bacterium]|nr:MAG: aldo/keto reductase [Planctomycetota bacterium]
MQYRSLGRSGVQVSPLCLGCMTFGARTPDDEAYRIVAEAVDKGINFIDTANVYSRGQSEVVTGEAIKRTGKRSSIILASKVHGAMDDDDPNARGNSRHHIMQAVEASLKRLQTDYIDLYQIHRPMPSIPIDETLRALDDLVRQGKIRYFGFSTFAAYQVVESLWTSDRLGLNRVCSEQPPYHLLDRRIERELVPMAQQYGLAILPWSPLAGGMLSGKYDRESLDPEKRPKDSRFHGKDNQWINRNFAEAPLKILDTIKALASEHQCTPSQIALAWVVQQPGITSAIIGPRTFDQLIDNLGCLEVELSEDDNKRLDAVSPPGRAISPYYQAEWGPSHHRQT